MGYALLKAKSSKILKQEGLSAEDETAEGICSLYVLSLREKALCPYTTFFLLYQDYDLPVHLSLQA